MCVLSTLGKILLWPIFLFRSGDLYQLDEPRSGEVYHDASDASDLSFHANLATSRNDLNQIESTNDVKGLYSYFASNRNFSIIH